MEAGWHPFLGINQQGLVKISPHGRWQPLDDLVSAPGQSVFTVTSNPTAGNGKTQSLLDPERAERLWLAM
ncbi:hypothetical protein [Microcystis aeruginosa]|uniref:hypothetical protein n=1 Tax=Microcystis aeruginosa TaxID=1126 RepID=UPI0015E1A46C|nr:hypothetical protein [Microcystis aeruginosa]